MTVVVAGEALVDLVPRDGLLAPLPGGSPYNVAIALARLGSPTHYLGMLSTDGFGELLIRRLRNEGVGLDFVRRTHKPTTLAVVHIDPAGAASYGFYLANTSATDFLIKNFPNRPAEAAVHISLGAVGLATEPAGEALQGLIAAEHGRRFVSLDPNVRLHAVGTVDVYRKLLESTISCCDMVKASDEDIALLYPNADPIEVAHYWAGLGPSLVVLTRGSRGAIGFKEDSHVNVPGERVDVVDSVGAGDAFTAALLNWLEGRDCLHTGGPANLTRAELRAGLRRAVSVAASMCTRSGSDLPRCWGDSGSGKRAHD